MTAAVLLALSYFYAETVAPEVAFRLSKADTAELIWELVRFCNVPYLLAQSTEAVKALASASVSSACDPTAVMLPACTTDTTACLQDDDSAYGSLDMHATLGHAAAFVGRQTLRSIVTELEGAVHGIKQREAEDRARTERLIGWSQ